jgi:hypothetical protein
MTKPIVNPFSKDYVPKIAIDYRNRKYKRPVLNQPSKDVHQTLNPKFNEPTLTEVFQRIRLSKI